MLITGEDMVCVAAAAGAALESDAPTGISQRWPGWPCGGLGSETAPALAAGAWASTGADVIEVVGVKGGAVTAGAVVEAGVVLSVLSSCWEEQAERAIMSESPRRWLGCMMKPRRDRDLAPGSATR